jgi:7-carboxy-7-deazaguanine synthase
MSSSKKYKVKEIFYTLQGEGFHAGRPAVFCRFSGCNLWSGREEDRSDAVCKFCDTDFWGTDGVNGGSYTAQALIAKIKSLAPIQEELFIVCTGGEPALQLDQELVDSMHQEGIYIAIETNGTKGLPEGIDWICVSPKEASKILITKGHELKLVYPQQGNHPTNFETFDFQHFYLQPLDDVDKLENTERCIHYCMENPKWKLSVQTHKVLGIP